MVLKAVLTKPNNLSPGAERIRHGECVRSLGRSSYTRCSKEDLFMRTSYDFTPFRRSTVGFDRLFDLYFARQSSGGGQPPPAEDSSGTAPPPQDMLELAQSGDEAAIQAAMAS